MKAILVCFRPEFDFTSQYIVKVDDFFLHYLQKVRVNDISSEWSEKACLSIKTITKTFSQTF